MPCPLTPVNTPTKSRAASFKKGIDAADARKSRSETRISVRKDKREEALKKKRAPSTAPKPATLGGAAAESRRAAHMANGLHR